MALNDVPQATQTLAVTQPLIRSNFSTVDSAFSVDHVAYGIPGAGKHNQITFPIHSGSVPSVGLPIASEIYLFNQNAAPTNISDIWLKRGAGTPYPITGSSQMTNGWTYLPSGILLKWGNITGIFANGTWQTFSYPTGATIPAFTNVFTITLQSVSSTVPPDTTQSFNYLTVFNTSNTQFQWIPRTNFGNVDQRSLFYFAIGR